MNVSMLHHPAQRFGDRLTAELESGRYREAMFVSAFAVSGGTSRIGDALKQFTDGGGQATALLGLANGVTSVQAVHHLIMAGARVAGFATGRSSILHSKVYSLWGQRHGFIGIGSCNLTGEGLYRNFESMAVFELDLPGDQHVLADVLTWVGGFWGYPQNLIALVPAVLPQAVTDRLLIDEAAVRTAEQVGVQRALARARRIVPSVTLPNLPPESRAFPTQRRARTRAAAAAAFAQAQAVQRGPLVWEKPDLPGSDSQRVSGKSNPVGGVRLVQAGFRWRGQAIDQTTYFRQLFQNYPWAPPASPRTRVPQEEALVPFDVTLLGTRRGILNLRVSHKPSGEARQNNYTTIIHWGPLAAELRTTLDIRGRTFRLFAPPRGRIGPFSLEVV